ncbi:MAG: hypothetical protein F2731_00450 [Actinobacteria bacterium]|uniref:Unannotated protein n=1 Tax=freshwater metagenome TaxID=449393 RepID=A0A6J6WG11_9ZZZZ|nr:hypothetical protein [Actinomycetota bacterium]
MADRDPSGRRILGRSSNEEQEQRGPTAGIAARPIIGRSSRLLDERGNSELRAGPNGHPLSPPAAVSGRKFRRRLRTVIALCLALALLLPASAFMFGWWQFSRLPTVNVASVLSPRGSRHGTNYLIVGTDSRAGISSNDPNAGAFLSGEVSGARTDTIMVLHIDGGTTQLASVPRDLWVTDPVTGQKGRINATFANGPSNLIKAVEELGIPVDHYLEINFVSFGKLVDSVDGITIDIPFPAKDDHSGLSLPKAGRTHLNGVQALAYVRSRYYEELVDGKWRVDGTADIGRTERQRAFLTALMHKVAGERNPLHLMQLPGSLGSGMKRDTTFGYFDALRLGWTLKDESPEPVALPVTPRRTSGGADVLELQASSTAVIAALSS